MPAVKLQAYYEGERTVLGGPFEIPPDASLMVTVLPLGEDEEGEDWILTFDRAFSGAYGKEVPEYGIEESTRHPRACTNPGHP